LAEPFDVTFERKLFFLAHSAAHSVVMVRNSDDLGFVLGVGDGGASSSWGTGLSLDVLGVINRFVAGVWLVVVIEGLFWV
jgi:hypothetical protein